MKLLILLFSMSSLLYSQQDQNLITSSSKSGLYVTTKKGNETHVYNLKENLLYTSFHDATPIGWFSDSCLIYYKLEDNRMIIYEYDILKKQSSIINSLSYEWFKDNFLNVEALSFPKVFLNRQEIYFYVIKNHKLCQVSLLDGNSSFLTNSDMFLRSEDLQFFSVSSDKKNIVFTSSDEQYGYLKKYNLENKQTVLIKKSVLLKNDDCFVYYTKNDNFIIFYEVSIDADDSFTCIYRYDLRNQISQKISKIDNCGASIFFDIPFKNSIYMNMFCLNIDIEVNKINEKLSDIIDDSFSVKKISYVQ